MGQVDDANAFERLAHLLSPDRAAVRGLMSTIQRKSRAATVESLARKEPLSMNKMELTAQATRVKR